MKKHLQNLEEEEAEKRKGKGEKQDVQQTVREDPLYSASMKRCLKIMERMII